MNKKFVECLPSLMSYFYSIYNSWFSTTREAKKVTKVHVKAIIFLKKLNVFLVKYNVHVSMKKNECDVYAHMHQG